MKIYLFYVPWILGKKTSLTLEDVPDFKKGDQKPKIDSI